MKLPDLIRILHRRACDDTTTHHTPESVAFFAGLNHQPYQAQFDREAYEAGLEIERRQQPLGSLAVRIQSRALRALRDWSTLRSLLETEPYSPLLLRALLQFHWQEVAYVQNPDSFEFCIRADILSAREQAPDEVRAVVTLLCAGYGPVEIAELTGATNGSREVGRALTVLARILEGDEDGSKKSDNRRATAACFSRQ